MRHRSRSGTPKSATSQPGSPQTNRSPSGSPKSNRSGSGSPKIRSRSGSPQTNRSPTGSPKSHRSRCVFNYSYLFLKVIFMKIPIPLLNSPLIRCSLGFLGLLIMMMIMIMIIIINNDKIKQIKITKKKKNPI